MAEIAKTAKITKDKVALFLDISKTITTSSWVPDWRRLMKSKIFDMAFNVQSTTEDYIAYETPIEETSGYQPEIPQECAMYRGDPIYDFVEDLAYDLQVGDALRVPTLVMFPPKLTEEGKLEGEIRAWQVKEARLILNNFNPVEGKITFNVKLGGTYDRGTVEVADGVPVFTVKKA